MSIDKNRGIMENQFDKYLNEMMDYAQDALSEQQGGGLFGSIVSFGASMKMDGVRRDMETQRDAVLDYASEIAQGAAPDPDTVTSYDHRPHQGYSHVDHAPTQQFLQTNPFLGMLPEDSASRSALQEELLSHYNDVAYDVGDVLQEDGDSFGELMQNAYTERDDAEAVLKKNFETAKTIATYAEDMSLGFLGDMFANFENDVQPLIEDGEEYLWDVIDEDLDEIYGSH